MWKLGSFFGAEGKSTPMNSYIPLMHQNSYLSVMHEIHVLLVDHDSDDSRNTKKLLEMCEYRVTLAELASDAISMLSNGKVKFHIIMANINSLDQHGIFSNLLPMAANMDIPIILMSVDDNTPMAMHAIEKGAFLLIKKPATTEMLSCLWQHVKKGKMHSTERERLIAANYSVHGVEFREVVHHSDENLGGNNMLVMKDKGKRKRTYDPVDNMMSQGRIKRKVCTEWTQELHQKFMDAVEQLGEGRCFPKEILEIMNVPGLTRMQVASHLQKCRNDNWRSPEERKSSLAAHSLSSDGDGSQYKPRRFGSMPRLVKGPSYHVQVNHTSGGGQGSKTQSESKIANDGGVENMGTRPIIASSTTTTTIHHDQLYRALNPHRSNAAPGKNSSQPPHSSAEDFFVQDMDYMTPTPQGSLVMNYPHSSSGGYNIDLVYGRDENAEVPSMENDRIQ